LYSVVFFLSNGAETLCNLTSVFTVIFSLYEKCNSFYYINANILTLAK